jgi:hypothetical protein
MFSKLVKEMGDKHLMNKWFGYESNIVIRHDTATLGLYRYGNLIATIDNTDRLTITPNMYLCGVTGRKAGTYLMGHMPRLAGMQVKFNQDNDRVVLSIGAKKYVVDPKQNVVIDFNCAIPEIKSETIPQYKMYVDIKTRNRVLKQWEDTRSHVRLICELNKGEPRLVNTYSGSAVKAEYEKMDFSKPPSLENRGDFVCKMLEFNHHDLTETLYAVQAQVLRTFKYFRTIKVAIPRGEI